RPSVRESTRGCLHRAVRPCLREIRQGCRRRENKPRTFPERGLRRFVTSPADIATRNLAGRLQTARRTEHFALARPRRVQCLRNARPRRQRACPQRNGGGPANRAGGRFRLGRKLPRTLPGPTRCFAARVQRFSFSVRSVLRTVRGSTLKAQTERSCLPST